jgi:heme-degrading monooxygenase HmoA
MPRTVIDKDRQLLTVVNEFHVTREQQEQIVRRFPPLMSEVVSKVPGFVSGNLHISVDGERVLTYYQWQSKDAYDAFLADEETAAKVSAVISEYGADRRAYEVVFQVWGRSEPERR